VLRKFIVEAENDGLPPTDRLLHARDRPLNRSATTIEWAYSPL
jgi:hypothetical protein